MGDNFLLAHSTHLPLPGQLFQLGLLFVGTCLDSPCDLRLSKALRVVHKSCKRASESDKWNGSQKTIFSDLFRLQTNSCKNLLFCDRRLSIAIRVGNKFCKRASDSVKWNGVLSPISSYPLPITCILPCFPSPHI
jgi:hypothetical protein